MSRTEVAPILPGPSKSDGHPCRDFGLDPCKSIDQGPGKRQHIPSG